MWRLPDKPEAVFITSSTVLALKIARFFGKSVEEIFQLDDDD